MGELYDAPNQQVVRADGSGPWDEGTGGAPAPEPEQESRRQPEQEAERQPEQQEGEQPSVKASARRKTGDREGPPT